MWVDPDQRRVTGGRILLLGAGAALFWTMLLLFSPASWLPIASLLLFVAGASYWAAALLRAPKTLPDAADPEYR